MHFGVKHQSDLIKKREIYSFSNRFFKLINMSTQTATNKLLSIKLVPCTFFPFQVWKDKKILSLKLYYLWIENKITKFNCKQNLKKCILEEDPI